PGADPIHGENAALLRRKFWKSTALVTILIVVVLLFQFVRKGWLPFSANDWLRIAAVLFALVAALGRGGWAIQSSKGQTLVERIDRGMYMIEQLGAAAFLMFALTL